MATTSAFIARWHALASDPVAGLRAIVERREPLSVVLVRGYLGSTMRGNLVSACRALRASGLDAWIAPQRAGGTVDDNAHRIAARIDARDGGRRLVFAGHSKGGLEALAVLAARPDLAARTEAVILSQTPRGGSRVLESVLLGAHAASLGARRRWNERAQRLGLTVLGARRGGLELTSERLPPILARLDAAPRPFQLVQTASWSTRPTTWLDSFHERLGEIAPGVAHDGQFYLPDLIWPGEVPHVLLPELDHAQPVMDGFGFDPARYWITMLALVLG